MAAGDFNLATLFESVADAVADREAVVDGDRRFTYGELDERATRLAHVMAACGIGPGDHVGVWLHNRSEYLETMLAAYKLRAVPVNVNYRYVEDELRYLFDDADLRFVVHEEDFAERLGVIRGDLQLLRGALAVGDEYERALDAASPERDFPPRSEDDLYVLYTGGTTGMPKGVLWRHEDILLGAFPPRGADGQPLRDAAAVVDSARGGRTRALPACPFMHGTAHWVALAVLYGGGAVVISPERHLQPDSVWQLVHDEKVSFLVIVGDAFARPLVDALDAAGPDRWDLRSLTVLLSGGAILSPTVKDALVRLLPSTLVVDGYGASETGGQGQMVSAPGAIDDRPRFAMNDQTAVLDDDGRPLPPGTGTVGRLARRGHIPLGYYKDEAKSAATFPVIHGVRWSVPGDMALVEQDGTIVLLGRGSVSINTGGEKVYPEEVEAALKGHPAVFDAVVVGVPDERWGERVVAVVQFRGATPALTDLQEHAAVTLARYKLPRDMVVVDAVVRSPSGKPDYRWAKTVATTGTA